MSTGFLDTASNFHPFECDGPGKCVHCDRRTTYVGVAEGFRWTHTFRPTPNAVKDWTVEHDPVTCALCDPEYDGMPNEQREARP